MLAEIIPKIAEMEQDEDRPYFPRPSIAGPERCIRQMIYWGLNFPKEPLPGRTLLVFDDGHWHEELTRDWINKSAFRARSDQLEVELNVRNINLKCHLDDIVEDMIGTERVFEHKAINHFTFERYWKEDFPLDYLTQTAIYIKAVQSIQPDINEGILLVKNKNTAQYLELLVRYGENDSLTIFEMNNSQGEKKKINHVVENIIDNAIKKFEKVQECIKSKTLPARQYDQSHWRCQYCQYGKVCYENYEQEFDALTADVRLGGDVADLCHRYLAVNNERKDAAAEEKALKKTISDILKTKEAKAGKAGRYLIEIKRQFRKGYTVEEKTIEYPTIRLLKEGR